MSSTATGLSGSYSAAKAAGAKYYDPGKPCLRGHTGPRKVFGGCPLCAKLRAREYYHIPENRSRQRARAKIQRTENRAARLAQKAEYRAKNAGKLCEKQKARYWAHPDTSRAARRLARKRNPEPHRIEARQRKASVRGAPGSHTAAEIARLLSGQNYRCAVCGTGIRHVRHADHIIPLARGGSNNIKNIQMLCPPCNLAKHARTMEEFAAYLTRLSDANAEVPHD